jgi:serine/threonine protein kinase
MSSFNISEQNETCSKSAAPEAHLARQSSQSSLEYERVKLLGVGGSGLVYLVERKLDGRQFALKVTPTSLESETCAELLN